MHATETLSPVFSCSICTGRLDPLGQDMDGGLSDMLVPSSCRLVSSCTLHRPQGGEWEAALSHSHTSSAVQSPICTSSYLYLHLIYKWNQLIQLPFHAICCVTQTPVLHKGWEGSSKGTDTSRIQAWRLEARSSLGKAPDIFQGKLYIHGKTGFPSSLAADTDSFGWEQKHLGRRSCLSLPCTHPPELLSIIYSPLWGF